MNLTDKLIHKFLKGKTCREEEKTLLNICLKDINSILVKYQEVKQNGK